MNFSDLKEQLTEQLTTTWNKIQESNIYISLSEKYQGLSPVMQKVVVAVVALCASYVIYSIPAGFVDSAKNYEDNFQNNRNLIRGLFRAARNPTINADQFRGPDFEQMKSLVEAQLLNAKVIESQKGGFTETTKPLPSKQVPSAIRQTGMTVEVKKLNLTQVVQLSQGLSSMHPNTKLAAVDVQADKEDPHYFTVKYTLSSLTLPMKDEKPTPTKKR